jgi:5-methylcytosine-specific restriction endonuclease McrA
MPHLELAATQSTRAVDNVSRVARRKITPAMRRQVARRYGLTDDGVEHNLWCAYCGAPGTMTWYPAGTPIRVAGDREATPAPYSFVVTDLDYDHVDALSKDGANTPENLLLACGPCNASKHDRPLSEWQTWLTSPRGRRSGFWVRFAAFA